MTLGSRTRSTLRRYWTDRLGVASGSFDGSGVAVGSADEGGVQLFVRGDALVVGAPDGEVTTIEQRTDDLGALDADDPEAIQAWLSSLDSVASVIGPTFYGYVDRESFSPVETDARVLVPDDEPAFRSFRAAVPDDEWAQGGVRFDPGETVGHFDGDELIAVAGYDVWDGIIGHLAVVTHPDRRNEGHGRAVVSLATDRALSDGLVPQYRTSDEWPWSVALARQLGFVRFATAYLGVDDG